MQHRLVALFLVSALLGACDSESSGSGAPDLVSGTVQVVDYDPSELEGDAFELLRARIEEGTLMIDVAYGGGCAEHDFGGYSPSANTLVYPPQLIVHIVHDGNGDRCRAYLNDTISLDVSALQLFTSGDFYLTVVPISSSSDAITIQGATS